MNAKTIKHGAAIAAILIATITSVVPTAVGTTVSIVGPESELFEGNTFEVTIEVDDVEDINSGMFDIYFNSKVIDVVNAGDGDCGGAVEDGNIGGTTIPIKGCEIIKYSASFDGDYKMRVSFCLPNADASASGSGHLATISFEVTGKNGDHSVLNFDHEEKVFQIQLVDAESNKINATWVDCNVTISGTSESRSPGVQSHKVTVYVKNRDDDSLNIELHIDGTYKANKEVSKDENEEYSSYTLDEGAHTFKIKWYDSDTDRWYETTEEHVISGETTVTLVTDEHIEDDYEISASVRMKNLDDDDLDVYLYVDSDYETYMSISPGETGEYGKYEFEDDEDTVHVFKIEWYDPDTGKDYEKITTRHITDEEEVVTMHVDKHVERDIISVPEAVPSPKPTQIDRKPDETSVLTAGVTNIADAGETEVTEIRTNTTLATTRDGGSENSISAVCILIASVALLFALMQFKRI